MYQSYSFLFFASCLSAQSDYNSSITPTCPGNQPTAGSSCPTAGLKCGYGKSCCCGKCSSRYQAECSNSNEWIVNELPEDCSACAFSTRPPFSAVMSSSMGAKCDEMKNTYMAFVRTRTGLGCGDGPSKLGDTGACDNALLGASKSCVAKGAGQLLCMMETASKLQECGEKDPTVPFGTSRDTLCGSLSKVETGLQHSLKVHCTPTEAELGSGSCGWWGWLECFGAVTLAAAACAVATAGAGIIPCAGIAVAAVGCKDCVCSILHC